MLHDAALALMAFMFWLLFLYLSVRLATYAYFRSRAEVEFDLLDESKPGRKKAWRSSTT